MPNLEELVIRLECEDSTLPMTLVKSLEQVCETLKTFLISLESKQNEPCSPDSSVSVLSPSTEALKSTILNMKNLERLTLYINRGVTNEFLINLINNAKKLKYLLINGSNISDTGIKALNNAEQLNCFSLELFKTNSENKLITDESIQYLSNKQLLKLNLSNCVNVTNKAVTLVKNLPNLRILYVKNSKVTSEIDKEIAELEKFGKTNLLIFSYEE